MLRNIEIQRNYITSAPGSVLYRCGETVVLCTASFEDKVPDWMAGRGKGWVTAEYNMLPGSTPTRKRRDRSGKVDGRTTEIQRLIGRSLRAVVDMEAMGEQSLYVDCDVLKADGGTRTAAITGGFIAMFDALRTVFPDLQVGTGPIIDSVAAISVGIVAGKLELDLDYKLDVNADVDMNVVMTGKGNFVEVQGTGEKSTFDEQQLTELLKLARQGIQQLTHYQISALTKP